MEGAVGGSGAFSRVCGGADLRALYKHVPVPTRPGINAKNEPYAKRIYLDGMVLLRDGFGFSLEGLGYGERGHAHGNSFLYGPGKDLDAAGLLAHGYATIYVAYHTNGGEKVFAYYADEKINKGQIQAIGLQAPLLTEAQYQALMALLAANPGVGLQEMLLKLHLYDFQQTLNNFNLDLMLDIIPLQAAFGITANLLSGDVSINNNMQQWWLNYEFSTLPTLPKDQPNLFFEALHYH
jgi:hypothetical protein